MRLIQHLPVGVKWTWKRGCRANQRWMRGVLWVLALSTIRVDVEGRRHRGGDGIEEHPELPGR